MTDKWRPLPKKYREYAFEKCAGHCYLCGLRLRTGSNPALAMPKEWARATRLDKDLPATKDNIIVTCGTCCGQLNNARNITGLRCLMMRKEWTGRHQLYGPGPNRWLLGRNEVAIIAARGEKLRMRLHWFWFEKPIAQIHLEKKRGLTA